jgi:pyruvate dehydrogenase E1 component
VKDQDPLLLTPPCTGFQLSSKGTVVNPYLIVLWHCRKNFPFNAVITGKNHTPLISGEVSNWQSFSVSLRKKSMADLSQIEIENKEWIESLQWVLDHESEERVAELLDILQEKASEQGISSATKTTSSGLSNSLKYDPDFEYPGDSEIEQKIYAAIRWNAMAMVVNANGRISGIGGHISTYSSTSHLYEVGLHHFFRGYEDKKPDLVYFQGHASPGLYARSFLEHRLSKKQLEGFRQEYSTGKGLPSYPHPQSMPDYWRYPTVSMGLGPIQAIYQARFIKYLENRELSEKSDQRVWAFVGDGEMDEPESKGALPIAAAEKLDNLIFVVNCNLQRLDGPVRGNSQVITEFEDLFRGAGWHVIKLIWGHKWGELLSKDTEGRLQQRLDEMPDGERQALSQLDGQGLKEQLFDGLEDLIEGWSDDDLESLNRGGHDPQEIYRAYAEAQKKDGPVVILAQTVKGYQQGKAGEASNVTHKQKTFELEQLKAFRDTLGLEIKDKELEGELPYIRFPKKSKEFKYLQECRKKLKGWLPNRENLAKPIDAAPEKIFKKYEKGSGKKDVNTTGVLVEILSKLLADKEYKQRVVPIVPDESRTFGMDALFGKFGIYAPSGQQYEPVDKGSLLYYNQKKDGVIIEEGITEAGSISSFIAAGTNHIARQGYMIPFYIFYSMFGFQRIGDLIWAAADAGARGFLVGGISGRTSLSGEGLQHADGNSHLYALAYPTIRAYDPAFAYELSTIIKNGMHRMFGDEKEELYYLTISNQGYPMPERSDKVSDDEILSGLYLYRQSKKRKNKSKLVNLMGSGAIMSEVLAAAEILENELELPTNIWSATSYKALYDEALVAESSDKTSTVEKRLKQHGNCFVAASDYVSALPNSIASWVPGIFKVLGTDGFGVSDTTPKLRELFEVNAESIVKMALKALYESDAITKNELKKLQSWKKK